MKKRSYLPTFSLSLTLTFLAACGGAGQPAGSTGGAAGSTSATGGSATGGSASTGGAGGSGAAGSGTGGSTGTGTSTDPDLLPVFVAQGHMGRITISCDDGKSWVLNHSLDDSVKCFDPLDCDHNAGAGRGLAYGDGQFIATFGWGEPGTLQSSKDGMTWEVVADPSPNYADIAYGQGVFIANASTPKLSKDGKTWTDSPSKELLTVGNPRAIAFLPDSGRFVITGESGDQRDIIVTTDGGQTFWHPDSRPDLCGHYVLGIAGGNGAIVVSSGGGFVCTSTDGGKTWQKIDLADSLTTTPVFTGKEIFVWQDDQLFRSADGLTWDKQAVSPQGIHLGAVTRSEGGTFVASNGGWMVWYDKQQFFRSTDGVAWEVLDSSKFTGSHPINFIEAGYAPKGTMCPAK
jgi:hypothetical protein